MITLDELEAKIYALDEVLGKLRYVMAGDYVMAEDHNSIVDSIKAMSDVLNALTDYASMIKGLARPDPLNRVWAPLGGWNKAWGFYLSDELNDFANSENVNAYIDEELNVLTFNPPEGNTGYVYRVVNGVVPNRIAIAFKVSVERCDDSVAVILVGIGDGRSLIRASIALEPNDVNRLRLVGDILGGFGVFENPGDWLILVIDWPSKRVYVYDKEGINYAEMLANVGTAYNAFYDIFIRSANDAPWREGIVSFNTYVDWVGIWLEEMNL